MTRRRDVVCIYLATLRVALVRDLLIVLVFRVFRKQVYIYLHGTELSLKNRLYRRVIKFIIGDNVIIYVSDGLQQEHEWLDCIEERVVPNGVNEFCNFNYVRKEMECLNLLFFSNVFKEKGIEEFIDVVLELERRGVDFRARICGSLLGGYSHEYFEKRLGGILRTGKVCVEGHTSGQQKSEVFEWADVLLFPSYRESFGNVIVEGMSAGVLVISSRTTSSPFILSEGSGFVVEDFVNEAVEILESIEDLERLGVVTSAYERYQKMFTEKKYFDNLGAVLMKKG